MARLDDVNTTDIHDAIRLGCRTMQNVFNRDDGQVPFFGSIVRPHAELTFSSWHSEAHVPGRHLNGLLSAEDAAGIGVFEFRRIPADAKVAPSLDSLLIVS